MFIDDKSFFGLKGVFITSCDSYGQADQYVHYRMGFLITVLW